MRKILYTIICLLPVAALFLVVVEVIVTNELAGLGRQLSRLEEEVAVQKDRREVLLTQVASASSLATLEVKARSIGFFEPTKHQILPLELQQFPLSLDQR